MKWNEQLKQERNLQGWTQTLLAKKLGTNTYTVSRWERGTAFPSLFYRQQLSRLFGKSLEQLGLIPELESRRTQHRHTAEPKIANVQQAEHIAELETANVQQAEHIAEPESRRTQHRHTTELETVSVQQTARIAELDTNLCSERPFSSEEQRGETTHMELVPRNASWYETVGAQQAAPVAELETVSVQQTHAAKPESCSTPRKWTPLDLEYESNKEDAIKALFTSRSENHSKLLAEKPLPKEPHKSFPSLNLSQLWLVIILSGVISLATILSLHAFMPSNSLNSMNTGGVCLAAVPPSSLPKAARLANGKYAATAPMNRYEATGLANTLTGDVKVSPLSFLFFLLFPL
jgi:transcriptional regulator with XRE-family HTH domain